MSNMLDKVQAVVTDRGKNYGHPIDNFQVTADLFNAYLHHSGGIEYTLTPQDVAMLMILVKMARQINDPDHQDTIQDILGYAETAALCYEATHKDTDAKAS